MALTEWDLVVGDLVDGKRGAEHQPFFYFLNSQGGRKVKYSLFYVLLLLLLLSSSPILAQESYTEFERGLNLTDSQKHQIVEIRKRYINEWQTLKRQSISKRLELRRLSKAPSNNYEQIEKIRNELGEIEGSRENLYNQYRIEVSKVLNEEQRERYNNFCGMERRKMIRPFMQRGYGR